MPEQRTGPPHGGLGSDHRGLPSWLRRERRGPLAQSVEKGGFESTASGSFHAEVVIAVVPRYFGVAARHDIIDRHHILCHRKFTLLFVEGVIGEFRSGGCGGGAEENGRPPLFCYEFGSIIEDRMTQGDAQVVSIRPSTVRLNEGMQALVRSDRTVEQNIMLAVDAAACRGKDVHQEVCWGNLSAERRFLAQDPRLLRTWGLMST